MRIPFQNPSFRPATACRSLLFALALTVGFYAHAQDSAPTPESQLRLVSVDARSEGRAFLHTTVADTTLDPSGIRISGDILTPHDIGETLLVFTVTDADKHVVEETSVAFSNVDGQAPFLFQWSTSEVSDGDYTVLLELRREPVRTFAWQSWLALKRSRNAVERHMQDAENQVAILRKNSKALDVHVRQALQFASDLLGPAAVDPDWIRADANAHVALDLLDRARSRATLIPVSASTNDEPGWFRAGLAIPAPASDAPSFLAYGLNLIGLQEEASEDGPAALIQSLEHLRESATVKETPLAVWLSGAGLDSMPGADVLDALARREGLLSVSFWTQPEVPLDGEQVRLGFIEYVKSIYHDRYELNRVWKRNLLDYNEIDVWRQFENRAYQYDWQTYQRRLATEGILAALDGPHRRGLPVTITLSDSLFRPGESRYGLDHAALTRGARVSSVRTASYDNDGPLALPYPRAQALYTLRRSFAPESELLSLHTLAVDPDDRYRRDLFNEIYSFTLDAALNGVDALALEMPAIDDPLQQAPEVIAGLAAAVQDIARMDLVVKAIRGAPAPIAILWSDSSKILDDGEAHLRSVLRAYAGCSYGGFKLRFLTEDDLVARAWEGLRLLVIPDTPALRADAYTALQELIDSGVGVARTTHNISYDERGRSLATRLDYARNGIVLRGANEPYDFLDAIDEAIFLSMLPKVPRLVNNSGYMLEGLKTIQVQSDGRDYLYILNLRRTPVQCKLMGPYSGGRNVLTGRFVAFPRTLAPLEPLLLELGLGRTEKANS